MMPVTIEMTEMGGTRSGARAQTSERIEMTAAEIQVIKDRRIEEKAERERQAKAQRLTDAVEAVVETDINPYQVAREYAVNANTLRSYVEARQKDLPKPTMGRKTTLTAAQIEKEKAIMWEKALSKDSVKDIDWDEYICSVIEKYSGKGSGNSKLYPSSFDPKTLRNLRDVICPDEVRKTYDQNVARYEALNEIYHQIAFAVVVRIALGYHSSERALGREEGEEPPNRNAALLYNGDGSQTFCGDQLPRPTHVPEGVKEELASKGRNVGTTKRKGAPKIQRRSIKYFVLSGISRMIAAVTFLKDSSFDKGSIRLYRANCDQKYFLVLQGPSTSHKELAKKVMRDIISMVITEDANKILEDQRNAPDEPKELDEYHMSSNDDVGTSRLTPTEANLEALLARCEGEDEDENEDEDEDENEDEDEDEDKGEDFNEDEDEKSKDEQKSAPVEGVERDEEIDQEELDMRHQEMLKRPLYFQDGERSFLAAILALVFFDRLGFDFVKSAQHFNSSWIE
jgi:hypothetical protein